MGRIYNEFMSYILTEATAKSDAPPSQYKADDGTTKWKATRDGIPRHGFPTQADAQQWYTQSKPAAKEKPTAAKRDATTPPDVTTTPSEPKAGSPKKPKARSSKKKDTSPLPEERIVLQDSDRKADKNKLLELARKVNADARYSPDDKRRFDVFSKLWNELLTATYERQVEIVRDLTDLKLIRGGEAGKTIFLGENLKLADDSMLGEKGSATNVTMLINQIIRDEKDIHIERLTSTFGKALNNARGTLNEVGVCYYLNPEDPELQAKFDAAVSELLRLGVGYEAIDSLNELNAAAAKIVQTHLPQGARVTGAVRIGNLSSQELLGTYGIDKKTDSTDMIIYYEVNGKSHPMKISAKIYNDVTEITMKNAGASTAAEYYLQDAALNTQLQQIIADHIWDTDDDDADTVKHRKVALKEKYMKAFYGRMIELAGTKEGQQVLLEMWRKAHSCGNNVYTLIVDRKKRTSVLHPPSYYCDPKLPFTVKYGKTSITIDMGGGGTSFLRLELKTETDPKTGQSKAPLLLFKHKTKKPKKPRKPKTKKPKKPRKPKTKNA